MTTPPRRELDLESLVTAIVYHRTTFFAFFFAVMAVATAGSLIMPRKYQATAVIQLLPRAGQEIQLDEVVKQDQGGYLEGRDRARTQIQIILSRKVGEEVVRQYQALGHTDLDGSPESVEALIRNTWASPREDTQLVEITVQHVSPDQAAVLANLMAQVYTSANLDSRNDAAQRTLIWLDIQLKSYEERMGVAQAGIIEFQERHSSINLDETVDSIAARVAALQAALGDATTRRVLAQSRLAQHQELLGRGQYSVLASMFQNPLIQSLSTSYATVNAEAAEVSARYGELHPDYQRSVARVKQISELLAEQVRRELLGERSEVETLIQQEVNLRSELEGIRQEFLSKQKVSAEYSELQAKLAHTRELYDALVGRRMEVDLQARSGLNDVQIVDAALVPSSPASPNLSLNLMVAIVVGLGGGLALTLLRHRLDDTLHVPGDLRHSLQAPLLSTIPVANPEELKAGVPALSTDTGSAHGEAIRQLRTNLLGRLSPEHCHRVLVASCMEGEGKSHVAANLAVALAQMGAKVLLVDANLRRPALHLQFGTGTQPGLTDCFAGERIFDASEAHTEELPAPAPQKLMLAWSTQVLRLHLLPSGSKVDFPSELLSSSELPVILQRLSSQYHFIILDSAAGASETLAMAGKLDGVVMVVGQGQSTRERVFEFSGQLRALNAKILGGVLNAGSSRRGSSLAWWR